jgi:hypothetical protein
MTTNLANSLWRWFPAFAGTGMGSRLRGNDERRNAHTARGRSKSFIRLAFFCLT